MAKRYGNNNTNVGGGNKNFVVGGYGGARKPYNTGNAGNASNASNTGNVGGPRNNDESIKFMVDGKNALIFARLFRTKRNGTQMVKFIIYDFDALKKLSAAIPLAILLKTAFPTLQLELTEIGDLTAQTPTQ
jgi:hypothetical protein